MSSSVYNHAQRTQLYQNRAKNYPGIVWLIGIMAANAVYRLIDNSTLKYVLLVVAFVVLAGLVDIVREVAIWPNAEGAVRDVEAYPPPTRHLPGLIYAWALLGSLALGMLSYLLPIPPFSWPGFLVAVPLSAAAIFLPFWLADKRFKLQG